jgi:prophage antirepressor-like protein
MTYLKEQNATSISKVFNFSSNNQPIQVEVINHEPYFVAADVCAVLNVGNVPDAIDRLDEDEKLISLVTRSGQKREVNLVNDSGLYNLIFQSRKPQAKAFRRWVTG